MSEVERERDKAGSSFAGQTLDSLLPIETKGRRRAISTLLEAVSTLTEIAIKVMLASYKSVLKTLDFSTGFANQCPL